MRRLILLLVSGALMLALAAMPALAQQTQTTSYERVVTATDGERFHASENWGISDWNSWRYGEYYRFAEPNTNFSDPAAYRFDIPGTGVYSVYSWHPAAFGYNTSTPIGVMTTEGLQWTFVDQSWTGGQWVYLGDFEMQEGDEWNVLVSRWTGGEGLIVADAILVIGR